MKKTLAYLGTVLCCVLVLFACNRFVTRGLSIFTANTATVTAKAKVLEILKQDTTEYDLGTGNVISSTVTSFRCRILDGEYRGREVVGSQTIDGFSSNMKPVEVGDRVVAYLFEGTDAENAWVFGGYERMEALSVLLGVFFLALLVFGRKKGVNTILSLVLTCLMVFAVFVPSILTGHNIYLWSTLTCLYTIAMTLLLVNGCNVKSLAAGLGCMGGLLVSGLLTLGMDRVLVLSGMLDENSMYLSLLNQENPINLNAIIFAGILIGALGAVMDVGMSVAASLHELKLQAPDIPWKQMVRSGLTIGRDMMGTMANTLVLAYIGSSLSVVLLLVSYTTSLSELLNREAVIVEILQALVGSLGILVTIPLTSLICGLLYQRLTLRPEEPEKRWNIPLRFARKPRQEGLPYSFAGTAAAPEWPEEGQTEPQEQPTGEETEERENLE